MNQTEFAKEYQAEYVMPPKAKEVYEIAEWYETICEDFDKLVCKARTKHDVAMPILPQEFRVVHSHAKARWFEAMNKLREIFDTGMLNDEQLALWKDSLRRVQMRAR